MLTTLALAIATTVSGANLLKNGDFEDHAAQYCKDSWCIVSDSAIAPWQLVSGPAVEVDNTPWKAYSGDWSMDLCGNVPYTIGQTVALTPGDAYTLTFMLNENYCGTYNKTGFVSATGNPQQVFFHNSAQFAGKWIPVTYQFVATDANTQIQIGSTTAGSCGPVIDNVILVDNGVAITNNGQQKAKGGKCTSKKVNVNTDNDNDDKGKDGDDKDKDDKDDDDKDNKDKDNGKGNH
ncbi:hypothetical protein HDV04_001225 [Boothiomyces sp. JEL0838]|nr:hypothetical protein HDV04_001225 [Boothiomyces sp. JEL0838]